MRRGSAVPGESPGFSLVGNPHHDFVLPQKFTENNSILFLNNSLLLKIPLTSQPPRENPGHTRSTKRGFAVRGESVQYKARVHSTRKVN